MSKRNMAKKIAQVSAQNQQVSDKLDKRMEENFNKWKEYDLLTAIIAICGLALSIVEYEFSQWMADSIVNDGTYKYADTETMISCDPAEILALSSDADPTADDRFQYCAQLKVNIRLELNNSNFVRVVVVLVSLLGILTLMFRHAAKSNWQNEDLPADMMRSAYLLGNVDST